MDKESTARPLPALPLTSSPWWTTRETASYLRKSPEFVMDEINAGRLRAARIGSRRTVLTCKDWCDAWVMGQSEIHPFKPRRV